MYTVQIFTVHSQLYSLHICCFTPSIWFCQSFLRIRLSPFNKICLRRHCKLWLRPTIVDLLSPPLNLSTNEYSSTDTIFFLFFFLAIQFFFRGGFKKNFGGRSRFFFWAVQIFSFLGGGKIFYNYNFF